MPFTEFACRSGGSNLNAGTRSGSSTEPGTAADFTYASGSWVAATGVFTVASGNPLSDGVAVGDFASVYANGSTVTGFVGRVTARTATTITVSTTVKAGTAPIDGTGTRTVKIGGAWQGPNGASGFPFAFIANTLVNVATNLPRVNLKNDQTYLISAAITHANTQTYFEGYSTSYGDGGRFTLDANANAIVPLTISGVSCGLGCFIITNNGASGTNAGLVMSSNNGMLYNGVVHTVRGNGYTVTAATLSSVLECEAYACNGSNTVNLGGFSAAASVVFFRCFAHANVGSNGHGFVSSSYTQFDHCVADSNGGVGFFATSGGLGCIHCDAYGNGSHGFYQFSSAAKFMSLLESCNAVKNTGFGINLAGAFGFIRNCGFGSGTMVNTSGATNIGATIPIQVAGSVTYPANATPWIDPANGDFRINHASAKSTGRGAFVQTAASYAGTVGYPDIGAAQHQDMSVQPTYGIGI